MEVYEVLRSLAIIIVSAEIFGLLARKLKAPQVCGQIIAGLIIGPVLGIVSNSDFIGEMAEVGVILLMFSAGLGTDLKQLMKVGIKAFFIALTGVIVPLLGGFLLSSFFHGFGEIGSELFIRNIFIGVIMTATSVSITVQALKDLGKLDSEIGTTIVSAAIIDDVMGIIVLTIVISMKDPDANLGSIVLKNAIFFVIAIVGGFIVYKLFVLLEKKYEHHRRIPILGIAFCFAISYLAEKYFGIADITGAYVAGIILCSLNESGYIERRMDIQNYMIFGPVFFASIGLKTSLDGMNLSLALFAVLFVLVALLCKIIGCGLMAKIERHSLHDSLKVGIGMMTRGEVALVVAQKGLAVGIMDPEYFAPVILLIIVSSIATPILMKMIYASEEKKAKTYEQGNA